MFTMPYRACSGKLTESIAACRTHLVASKLQSETFSSCTYVGEDADAKISLMALTKSGTRQLYPGYSSGNSPCEVR